MKKGGAELNVEVLKDYAYTIAYESILSMNGGFTVSVYFLPEFLLILGVFLILFY